MTTSETEPASEEFLANSRAGAGFEAVLANAAVGGFGGLFPSAELGRLAKAMVRSPKPVARRVVDLAARLGQVGNSRVCRRHAARVDHRIQAQGTFAG